MSDDKRPPTKISEEISKQKVVTEQTQRGRSLSLNKSEFRGENISPQGAKSENYDSEGHNKRMDKREENRNKRNSKTYPTEKKIEVPSSKNKLPTKGSSLGGKTIKAVSGVIKEGLEQVGKRIIPVAGWGITAYEIYDNREEITQFGKDVVEGVKGAYESATGETSLAEELQKMHEENPQLYPEPPKLENLDKVNEVTVSDEYKENFMSAMQENEPEKPDFLKDLEPDIEPFEPDINSEWLGGNEDDAGVDMDFGGDGDD